MSLSFIIYLKYFLTFLLAFTAFFIIGSVLLRLIRLHHQKKSFAGIFLAVFIGIIGFNVIYSCLITQFKTVQILFLFPLAFAFIESKLKSQSSQNEINAYVADDRPVGKAILILLFGALIIFTFCFLKTIKTGYFPYIFPSGDYIFYSNNSYFINLTGHENFFNNLNLLDEKYQGTVPHHYYDTWLNAGISNFAGGISILHFMLNTFPVIYLLSFVGILAVWEHFKPISIKQVVLSLLFLFLGGVHFEFYSMVPFLSEIRTFCLSAMGGMPKLAFYYLFGLAFFILHQKGNKTIAYITIVSIPIASMTGFPAIMGGFIIFLLILIKWKLMDVKEIRKLVGYSAAIIISIPAFYFIFENPEVNMEGTTVNNLVEMCFNSLFNISDLKTRFNIFASSGIQTVLAFIPFILIVSLLYKNLVRLFINNKSFFIPILLIASIYISGIVSWVIFFKLLSGVQLFFNASVSLVSVALIVFSIVLFTSQNVTGRTKKTVCAGIIIISCIWNLTMESSSIIKNRAGQLYSDKYIQQVQKYCNENKEIPAGASILEKEAHTDHIFSFYHFPLGNDYLAYIKNGFLPITLCDYEGEIKGSDLEKDRKINARQLGIFYQFVQAQQKAATFVSMEQSQVDFINRYDIKYAVLSKNAIFPQPLLYRVREQFADALSGQRFIILLDK